MSQTNVKTGPIVASCGVDLTNSQDHLVEMTHASGVPSMLFSENQSGFAIYLVLEGAAQGENGYFAPLNPNQNIRVPIVGTCDPGDRLIMADPEVGDQAGKATRLVDGAGTYRVVGIAEELAVDGQLLLMRPLPYTEITIT